MPPDLQKLFLDDIYQGTQTSAPHLVGPVDRLNIYQNNALLGLRTVLENIYPVVLQIIGDDCFRGLASRYIKQNPARSGNNSRYGQSFPEFLATQTVLAELPYLKDVATLEYYYAIASNADDGQPLTIEDFSRFTDQTVTALHPSATLLTANYNALEIWQAHQQQPIQNVELVQAANAVLAWRDQNDDVLFKSITKPVEDFLRHCQNNKPLAAIMVELGEGAALIQQDFMQLVNSGLFICGSNS